MSDLTTIEANIMNTSRDEEIIREAHTIECSGNHDTKVFFQSDEKGCSEHMQLCSSCFSAYIATLSEDNIEEAGANEIEDTENSMDAVKACLLMAHSKNEVFSLKMQHQL